MSSRRRIQEERDHHAYLDRIAAACGERTEAGASHFGCEYCAVLARYYASPYTATTTEAPR